MDTEQRANNITRQSLARSRQELAESRKILERTTKSRTSISDDLDTEQEYHRSTTNKLNSIKIKIGEARQEIITLRQRLASTTTDEAEPRYTTKKL